MGSALITCSGHRCGGGAPGVVRGVADRALDNQRQGAARVRPAGRAKGQHALRARQAAVLQVDARAPCARPPDYNHVPASAVTIQRESLRIQLAVRTDGMRCAPGRLHPPGRSLRPMRGHSGVAQARIKVDLLSRLGLMPCGASRRSTRAAACLMHCQHALCACQAAVLQTHIRLCRARTYPRFTFYHIMHVSWHTHCMLRAGLTHAHRRYADILKVIAM